MLKTNLKNKSNNVKLPFRKNIMRNTFISVPLNLTKNSGKIHAANLRESNKFSAFEICRYVGVRYWNGNRKVIPGFYQKWKFSQSDYMAPWK